MKPNMTPVIFFGTLEVGAYGSKALSSWRDGLAANFAAKAKVNRGLAVAMDQVGAPRWLLFALTDCVVFLFSCV